MVSNVTRNQITVITTLLNQVIVPNLVIDENATEVARKTLKTLLNLTKVTFEKGEKILFEGEPVTQLKRDALRKAGYITFFEIGYRGYIGYLYLLLLLHLHS